MDAINIKELIQNKQAIIRHPRRLNPFDLLPPWRLFDYIPMIKQPQV